MKDSKRVREYMHAPVHTIGSTQTLSHAKHVLYTFGIHHLPVLDGGRCIGIISDRDVKLAYAVEEKRAENILVKDACTSEVYEVSPQTPLAEVARHMANEKIGSAMVVENGKLCGIFTVTDACRALAEIAA